MDLADPLLTVPETQTPRVRSGWQWILEDQFSSMKRRKIKEYLEILENNLFSWKYKDGGGASRLRRAALPVPLHTAPMCGDNGYFTCDRGWLMSWPQWISTLAQSLPIRHHSLGLTGSQMREKEVSRWMSIYVLKTLIGDQREPLRAARDDFENSHKWCALTPDPGPTVNVPGNDLFWRYWRYLESYLKSGCHGSCRQKIHQKMELAEWLVILIFKWKLRQFGETLRKTRQILENDETLRKTGIMQGIPALHDYQCIFASLLIWMWETLIFWLETSRLW